MEEKKITGKRNTGKKTEKKNRDKAAEIRSMEEKNRDKTVERRGMEKKNTDETAKRWGMEKEYTGGKSVEGKYIGKKSSEKKSAGKQGTGSGYSCSVSKKCGGCQYLHLEYQVQLDRKQKQVQQLLKPFCKVYPIVGMEQPTHYRNKVHAVFSYQKGAGIVSGTYQEGTHQVVPVDNCLLENEKADAIICTIRSLLRSFKIQTYDEDTGYGLLRHVLIRTAHRTGEIMVVLVLASPILPSKNNFVRALRKEHPEITTIVLNVNDKKTSMVLGEREIVLYGRGYIEDILCGCRFRISARSFYQINSVQTEALYAKAMELAHLTGKERVIDAYCGIGTIGLVAAKDALEVIGVELNEDAVRDAVRNAKMNHGENVRFYANDAGKFMTGMSQQGEHADVVFMDPPRSGSDEAFLTSVVKLAPERIVYISCNPETQARDLAWLTKHGYRAEGGWPYDMFPFTDHVETVCLLSRKAQ